MPTTFTIQEPEIKRRYTASLTLVISLILGYMLAAVVVEKSDLLSVAICSGIFLIVLMLLRSLALSPFKQFLKTQIILDDQAISKNDHIIKFADIKHISLLRTSRGLIRDITICPQNGRVMIIDAVRDFENCLKLLLSRVPDIKVKYSKEPIDYDHPLFYFFLGIVVGFGLTSLIDYILSLGTGILTYIVYGFSLYLLGLGIYFMTARPLSQRYAGRSRMGEIICGIVFVIIGIVIAVFR